MAFTPEELEAMRLADEDIERNFRMTDEEFYSSRELDQNAKDQAVSNQILRKRQKWRAAYWRDPEKHREKARAYYHANAEACKARQKEWQKRNPGDRHRNRNRTPVQPRPKGKERIEHDKTYYERNREKILARNKAWRAANPDYQREWKAANREKVRAYGRDWYQRNREKKLSDNHERYLRRKEAAICSSKTQPKSGERPSEAEPIAT